MPAKEDYLRDIKVMHWVFFVSCIALVWASVWAVQADYNDEWRTIQPLGYEINAQQLRDKERKLESVSFDQQKSKLKDELKLAEVALKEHESDIAKLETKSEELRGTRDLLLRKVRSTRAERDKARADMGLKIRDGLTGQALEPYQKEFDRVQEAVNGLEADLQLREAAVAENDAELAKLTRERDEVQLALKKHTADIERLEKALSQISPTGLSGAKWALMELPVIEGFNGHTKPNQIWLPNLKIGLGMAQVARFDRCLTCHMNIDKVEPGNIPAFPHDVHGFSPKNGWELLKKDAEAEKAALAAGKTYQPEPRSYAHPFSTHPNPDLYLTAASPHPMQKFGCTSCHDGQGSGTSFHNVQHMPDDPAIGKKWNAEYGWSFNHFWEYPMFPKRLEESGCIKCHHNVVELGVHPQFGASAPKAFEGFRLIEQYGCFGCHEINGYNAGKQIGPDLRLEPQTEEEKIRIKGDPTAVAGEYRKVGPGLQHINQKVERSFVEFWVTDPQRFHPETRMPKFFNLTNQTDDHAKDLQPIEIAGIAKFLEKKSQKLDVDDWNTKELKYTPSAVNGKKMFATKGCVGCHKHGDFQDANPDFGPDLSHVSAKIKRDADKTSIIVGEPTKDDDGKVTAPAPKQDVALSKWMYTWIRDPKRHSARTRMPNLYLEAEGEGEGRVDPAADIVAYLLAGSQVPGSHAAGSEHLKELEKLKSDIQSQKIDENSAEFGAHLDELTQQFLSKTLSIKQVELYMKTGKYPHERASIKGDEIELKIETELLEKMSVADKAHAIREARLMYVGRRTISRYGCYGCHDIPEFEKARPIGTALQDWGRKDPTKLAMEHIEEFLHHHGEPEGSRFKNTAERAAEATRLAAGGEFSSPEERERETSAAYFYDQLHHHNRAGFLWQKLRDPRSYDYEMTETKNYDERLRMPQFPLNEQQVEAIATFVLGLVADPPADEFVYHPTGRDKARIDGEKLLSRYNCTTCHMVELPQVKMKAPPLEYQVPTVAITDWAVIEPGLKSGRLIPFLRGLPPADLAKITWKTIDEVEKKIAKAVKEMKPHPQPFVDALFKNIDPDSETIPILNSLPPSTLTRLRSRLESEGGAKQPEMLETHFGKLLAHVVYLDTSLNQAYIRGKSPEELEQLSLKDLDSFTKSLMSQPATSAMGRLKAPNALGRLYIRLAKDAGNSTRDLPERFDALLEGIAFAELDPTKEHAEGLDLLLKLKPARPDQLAGAHRRKDEVKVAFRGLLFQPPDLDLPLADQEHNYVLWETLQLGQQILLPQRNIQVKSTRFVEVEPGRGGDFAMWLAKQLRGKSTDKADYDKALQAGPPVLYQEGMKVQTPWLFNFLKNPPKLRHTTVLRMPQFTLSELEAQQLADYFAAVDDTQYPYQRLEEREPGYLAGKGERSLDQGWDVINLASNRLCNGCHSVGGRPFNGKADDPKVIRGPNLEMAPDRLRSDWLLLWLYKPAWITPYTSMPSPFTPKFPRVDKDGKSTSDNPQLFGGDENLQTIGARDALINYHRLMERKSMAATPPTPMQPAPTTEPPKPPEAKPADAKPADAKPSEKAAAGGSN